MSGGRAALPFVKMQGLGNDFLVIDLRGESAPSFSDWMAVALCDRHFGVGADGVLLVLPSDGSLERAARMRVLNADGSEAEMCGNGLRCVVKYLWERGPQEGPRELEIETGAGLLRCRVVGGSGVEEVEIDMGQPVLLGAQGPLWAGDRVFPVTAVSMGNPHAVTFLQGDEPLRAVAERYGPLLERHVVFPQQANVSFARRTGDREIDLVVWERGCGITLACGTGACATAVAGCLGGLFPEDQPLQVRLPGGPLQVTVEAAERGVRMRGPAVEVFRGEVLVDALERARPVAGQLAGVV